MSRDGNIKCTVDVVGTGPYAAVHRIKRMTGARLSLVSFLAAIATAIFAPSMRPRHASAAPPSDHDLQLWFQGAVDASLGPRGVFLSADAHLRRGGGPPDRGRPDGGDPSAPSPYTELIVRPILGFRLPEGFAVGAGYAYYGVYHDDPSQRARLSLHEHRAFTQGTLRRELPWKLAMSGRLRLEHRMRSSGPGSAPPPDLGGDSVDAPDSARFAHRLRVFYRVDRALSEERGLRLVAFSETFLHLNASAMTPKAGFNQQRSFLGISADTRGLARFEIGYLNQFIRRLADPNIVNHMVFTSVFIRIGRVRSPADERGSSANGP